jgi:hypothetical protein
MPGTAVGGAPGEGGGEGPTADNRDSLREGPMTAGESASSVSVVLSPKVSTGDSTPPRDPPQSRRSRRARLGERQLSVYIAASVPAGWDQPKKEVLQHMNSLGIGLCYNSSKKKRRSSSIGSASLMGGSRLNPMLLGKSAGAAVDAVDGHAFGTPATGTQVLHEAFIGSPKPDPPASAVLHSTVVDALAPIHERLQHITELLRSSMEK